MRFTQQHIIHGSLYALSALGCWIMCAMLEVNPIRGDEFLSYLHSDPRWTYAEIIRHIQGGADNSYVHAVILRWAFGAFGHTIVVQRAVSLVAWLVGVLLLYGVIKKNNNKGFNSFLLVCTGFSNIGFFLATDGRFYALLFLLATASLYIYLNRLRWSILVSTVLFTIVQLLGLLTSANFIVFQFLFAGAMMGMFLFEHNRARVLDAGMWVGSIVVAATVYFSFCKIPYFHSYFLSGFFTEVPIRMEDLKTFASIPFRWLMLPHIPYGSDVADVLLFVLMAGAFAGYHRKAIVTGIKSATAKSRFIGLMAIGLLVGLGVQLFLYCVNGFPLWESRYYAAVFFVVPAALLLLLSDVFTIKILLVCCCLWLTRLAVVEYPKIGERKETLGVIAQRHVEILSQPKPVLFAEQMQNHQSSLFVLMGNLYIRYPETRGKLFLMSDPTVVERAAYFKRLSDWHYPMGLVFTADSSLYYKIETEMNP
ncbi:MAG: hypothetical protein V4590_10175 [Bacteroidota bacterium]